MSKKNSLFHNMGLACSALFAISHGHQFLALNVMQITPQPDLLSLVYVACGRDKTRCAESHCRVLMVHFCWF